MATPENSSSKLGLLWLILLRMRWHHWGRIVASLVLLDQALGPITAMPDSEAVVVLALGALFAPVPTERRREKRDE